MHTTNYFNTFIAVADDCPVQQAQVPTLHPERPSVAAMQYQMITEHPYAYTSDDVLFIVHARRQGLAETEWAEARTAYFSKGRACLRASALPKRYGFGVHCDGQGRVALVGLGTEEYGRLARDKSLEHVKAMRHKRAQPR